MSKSVKCRLIKVEVDDQPGQILKLSAALRDADIDINVINGWVENGTGKIVLCTSDAAKACQTLSPLVNSCEFDESVCVAVEDRVGSLSEIAEKLAGVNIKSILSSGSSSGKATLFIQSEDNDRVLELLGGDVGGCCCGE